ncbi:protein kinase domain-containing protein [Senegalimassilia anaerobia]|uniref:protein kinase domain-containing protein n=1 Tax=Senegalimassilia anaerobia TaxID=1473216 RepID=UPI003A9705C9
MSGLVDKGGALASSGAVQGMRLVRVADFSAPLSLSDADRPSYVRRFVTLFVSQGQGHHGGTGRVEHARNAQGEHLALKLLSLPHRRDGETEEDHERRVRASHAAFEREYECHILLSGLKGFPRLYGRGTVDGVPCIVMEWVEGITLDRVRRRLAVDGCGRVSPLVAARMGYVEGGFVHRDISPRNVMVRTSRLSLEQQVDEGVFGLYLIDFGSSAESEPRSTSFTSENAVFRGATADFAPPEMLSDDIPGLAELRKSPAIDVYAAASVVYQLACGQAPYDLHAVGEDGVPVSPYRAKMVAPAPAAVMAHACADELLEALAREPEVAVAVQHAQDKLSAPMGVSEAAEALSFVDEQLGVVLGDCLARGQSERPDAAAVRNALSSFSIHYADNVERSFCGRPLVPCVPGGFAASALDVADSTLAHVRMACKGVAAAALAGVAVSAAVLANGAQASLDTAGFTWSGGVPGVVVAVAALFPALVGLSLRFGGSRTTAGFLRGTAGLAVTFAALWQVLADMRFEAAAQQHLLSMALVAAVAAGWCIMVADFALNVALPQMIRRKALPSGNHDGADALPGAAAPALEGNAGKGETQKVCGADSQPEYEVDDPADKASGANARFTGKRDALDDDTSEGA